MAEGEIITVAYDGECLMCNRGVRFLAEHDRQRRLRFVALQTPLGQEMEAQAGTGRLSTVIMKQGERVFANSEAILVALKGMGGILTVLGRLGTIIPESWRDRLYRYIAQNRYRWFGKKDNICALPSEALRERLIDGERV
jgi:predicted DCC family thiol-disulfide oxidoreductase YuxK